MGFQNVSTFLVDLLASFIYFSHFNCIFDSLYSLRYDINKDGTIEFQEMGRIIKVLKMMTVIFLSRYVYQ